MKLLNGIVNPIAHIVCRDSNRLIGTDDKLPWKCKEDMKYFQSVTRNKLVILGYNTYKSIRDVYKNSGFSLSDPLLKDRISIVIADPTRFGYPPQQLNYTGMMRLIQAYTLESDEAHKLLGFTVFVESLEQALHVAGIIKTCLKSAMSSHNKYGDWFTDVGSPMAYVIGGSKLYQETLERAYVSEIYETILPVWCNIKEGEQTYYYPEVDNNLYRDSTIMRSKCTIIREGVKNVCTYMEVHRHKRKIGLESIQ